MPTCCASLCVTTRESSAQKCIDKRGEGTTFIEIKGEAVEERADLFSGFTVAGKLGAKFPNRT